jgi:hypothetical protein
MLRNFRYATYGTQDGFLHWVCSKMTSEASDSSTSLEEARIQRIFRLIEDMVPLELCLQYNVLPLRLKGDCLHLGMVNPSDIQGLDAVRRRLAANNCFPSARTIPPQLHRLVIKAFMVHRQGQHQQAIDLVKTVLNAATPAGAATAQSGPDSLAAQNLPQNLSQNRPPAASRRPSQPINLSATLIVDRPDALDGRTLADLLPPAQQEDDQQTMSKPAGLPTLQMANPDTETFPGPPAALRGPVPPPSPAPKSQPITQPVSQPPVLQVSTQHLAGSPQTLAVLPPQTLVQELLGRALLAGITYIEFNLQGDNSRILWNQSGVLQPLLTGLSSYQLNGILDCLYQRLASNRSQPIATMAYQYQQQDLVLDLRSQGTTTSLRILKGSALRFFQQQQASQLKQESILLIDQLRSRLNQLNNYRNAKDLELAVQSRSTLTVLYEQIQALLV